MGNNSVITFAAMLALTIFHIHQSNAASGECPLASQNHACNPKCVQDADCTYGKKCCSNLCNTKSCAEPKNLGSSGYKGSGSSGGSGTFCNNQKCGPFEKCGLNKSTNRMQCMRA